MAYRRRQGITRASTFEEEIYAPNNYENDSVSSNSSSSSLAARAIRASAAHRDSSAYGSAYGGESFRPRDSNLSRSKEPVPFESTSMKVPDESKYGFWGILARKAKAILEEENVSQQFEGPNRMRPQMTNTSTEGQVSPQQQSSESLRRMDNARLRKGLDAITSSLNHIGDTIGNALEEGRTIVENKTADIIQETRKLQSKRRGGFSESSWQQPGIQPSQMHVQTNQETQLKASRDVAMATAAKAKLLLRELKTTKADLAFARERCAQLEEENKRLRESREKGDNHADDDLIRLQLETLLAEKARLAHENSIYARENRFLREIVEYHQLTMQDVVYLDEGSEEVSEVYPISINDAKVLSSSPTSPTSPVPLPGTSPSSCPRETKEYTQRCSLSSHPLEKKELNEAPTALKESASV
ncbi:hypothetical protein Nepgr_011900 [Nepenthes gracilis]|uniref:Uncharacterized protein n=1 Tax=Nepenthes gracilis TaxID=150966 RepID=A0AAD3SFZ8_NEPGR|nr:hypothetical protein Nepgr_011900 [Nepenthes gracilis]